jgi:hypothetical protein
MLASIVDDTSCDVLALANGDVAGLRLAQRHELLQVLHGHVVVHRDDERHRAQVRHGREGRVLVVRQRLLQVLERRVGAVGPDEDRVAVRCGLGHVGRAQHSVGAGLVVDDDRLAERLGHVVGERAGDLVGGAAGREGHDELDRLRRILREAGYRQCGGNGEGGEEVAAHEGLQVVRID